MEYEQIPPESPRNYIELPPSPHNEEHDHEHNDLNDDQPFIQVTSRYQPRKLREASMMLQEDSSRFSNLIKSTSNVLRQSGYLIAVIQEKDFIQRGAKLIDYGIYMIQQEYQHDNCERETVALIGIPIIHVHDFFEEESELIKQLRVHPSLSYIENIQELCCNNTCDILSKFASFFDNCESHYLLLLNIEPKGEGRYTRIYPYPRFTLPGGKMENRDCNDFLQCAIREFAEETHIILTTDNYNLISQKKIIKDIKAKKDTSSTTKKRQKHRRFNLFHKHFDAYPTKIVSFYFAIRIKD